MTIIAVDALEVLDSRGRPTVEATVAIEGGFTGRGIAPSGASTGRHEAHELRDGGERYRGRGVRQAVRNVVAEIGPALIGLDAADQAAIDRLLCELDGTPNKARLGANAILAVSIANLKAASHEKPIWRDGNLLPMPMVNILSGGLHAGRNVEVQDFLVIPKSATSIAHALEMIVAVYDAMRDVLSKRGLSVLKADEGGFGPSLDSNREALDLLIAAVETAGLRPGDDIVFALDIAATHFFENGEYQFEGLARPAEEMIEILATWCNRYPIVSIEDGLAEDDWDGWRKLTDALGNRMQLIGDDLFTTNPARLRRGVETKTANSVLVKMNQIGTITETLEVIQLAKANGYRTVVSARSGETEDTTMADLAVATGAGQIKIGSVNQSERLAKYNRLLRTEKALGDKACLAKPF